MMRSAGFAWSRPVLLVFVDVLWQRETEPGGYLAASGGNYQD